LLSCGTAPAARGVYNLSDDRPMEQFVGAIAGALGRPAPRLRVPEPVARAMAALLGAVPGFPLTASRVEALSRRVRYPPARIQRELGYSFGVSVEQGLQRLVADWRACR
jgi:nucleoside-diphosphate-sugar epimerase